MPGRRRKWTDADLQRAVAEANSIAGVLRKLGLQPAGGNYENVRRNLKQLALDVSHWTGQGHLRGKRGLHRPRLPLAQLLRHGSGYHSNKLRRRLIAEGVLEPRCSACGLERWLAEPIPLELDHIDGDRENNELSNLRLVCPNCHAFTPTYRGKNKRIRYARKALEGRSIQRLVDV
jgi:HNH endonuclease